MNRPCLDCGRLTRATTSRCGPCQKTKDHTRNRERTQYRGGWKTFSREARAAEPWCHHPHCPNPLTTDLTFDHEHWRVECRSCNSSHRRDRDAR